MHQVLHATPLIRETLQNVRTLLSTRGQLFLLELDPGKIEISIHTVADRTKLCLAIPTLDLFLVCAAHPHIASRYS